VHHQGANPIYSTTSGGNQGQGITKCFDDSLLMSIASCCVMMLDTISPPMGEDRYTCSEKKMYGTFECVMNAMPFGVANDDETHF